MLMLKMLMFRKKIKDKKECIVAIYYKCELSLFGRDDTKQTKSFIFIVLPEAKQVPKVQKKKKKKKKKIN